MPKTSNRNDALTTWGPGQLCAFSGLDGQTDYRHGLVAQTTATAGLRLRQPDDLLVQFGDGVVQDCAFGADWFEISTGTGVVRGCFLDAHHLLFEGPVTVVLSKNNRQINSSTEENRTLLGSIGYFNATLLTADLESALQQRQAWVSQLLQRWQPPTAWQAVGTKCAQQLKSMVYAPEGQFAHRATTPDRWPHQAVWLWDSAFHAIGYRHLDLSLAKDALDAVFDAQLPDGQIAIAATPYLTCVQRTQPPVLAWAVEKIMELTDDVAWLADKLPRLTGYLSWIAEHRQLGDVYGWVEDGNEGWSVCDESGMDNSPRFSGTSVLRAIDLTVFMAREYQAMARLAARCGHANKDWQDKAGAIHAIIERDFWDNDLGTYVDLHHADGSSTGIEAVTGFLPLILGNLHPDRVQRLAEAVYDTQRFGSALPLPTMSRRHADLYAKDMWKGPVWINTNWMAAEGFAASGRPDVAEHIRKTTLNVMQQWQDAAGVIYEFYDDDNQMSPAVMPRKGKNAPEDHPYHQVMHDFGWSATLATDWLSRSYSTQA